MKSIFGGSESKQQSSSGFQQLPAEMQRPYKQFAGQLSDVFSTNQANRFGPMAMSDAERAAIGSMNAGFTPNQNTLNSDIAMQMNPYDKFVIDGINREANGQNSILQKNLSSAGQIGSNRQMLGANDIDLSRLQQIGQFKQGQFNSALDNAMKVLPALRANDASTQLQAGQFLRGLDTQNKQADLAALQAYAQLLGVLPTDGGTTSTGKSSSSEGLLKPIAGGIAGAIMGSDIRLKENISRIGVENGFPIYAFNYIGDDKKYIGVMAQDVEDIMPHAVHTIDGFKAVDYGLIGVKFREA